jgi:hypothetical protein
MQYPERIEELNPEEIKDLINSGYKRISNYSFDILYHPIHWVPPQHDQKYDFVFDDIPLISLTPEAKEFAVSGGYELSDYPITNSIIEFNLIDGIYSQDEIEGYIGGSFADDITGDIDYPPEEELMWKIFNHKVYLTHNDTTWSRSPNFDSNTGNYLEDWVLEK